MELALLRRRAALYRRHFDCEPPTCTAAQMQEIDALIDDGNLLTSNFQRTA